MNKQSLKQTRPLISCRRHPLALAVALALSTPVALGATITVNSEGSGPGTASECTLTDAVTAANTDTLTNGCTAGSGTDLIFFDSTLSGSTITPDFALVIESDLTIDGGSAITLSGGNSNHPVFYIDGGTNVTLQGLTISNGYNFFTQGGGIHNDGTLTLQNSTLSDNSAAYGAGGIENMGTLTVQNSTLSGNSTHSGDGGGIRNWGSLTIQDSTLSGNSARDGGGIDNIGPTSLGPGSLTVQNSTLSGNSASNDGGGISNQGTLTVEDSTLSGNSASNDGGGIFNEGTLTVQNSTLSGNSASSGGGPSGGGLHSSYGTENISNSVIANSTGNECYFPPGGALETNTNNWFGDGSCDGAAEGDPGLGPLADNGGPTLTHLPLVGSGLIDTGENGSCTAFDQRGVSRPKIGNGTEPPTCDVGAVEISPDICSSDPAGLILTGPDTLVGIRTDRSETSLSTIGEITVSNGADVIFEAGDWISLGSEFQVEIGGTFTANIASFSCQPF